MLMAQFKATHHGWCPGPQEYDLYDGVDIPEPTNLFDDFSYRGTAIHEQTAVVINAMQGEIIVLRDAVDLLIRRVNGLISEQAREEIEERELASHGGG